MSGGMGSRWGVSIEGHRAGAIPMLPSAQRRAIALVAGSLGLGVLTQALFYRASLGLNFFLWDVAVAAVALSTFSRGKATRLAGGIAVTAAAFGAAIALRASPWSATLAIPFTVALLAVLPLVASERLTLEDWSRLLPAWTARWKQAPAALVDTAKLPAVAVGATQRGPLALVAKGTLIALPTTLLFVALLAADPSFGQALRTAFSFTGDALGFTFSAGLTTVVYGFVYHLIRRPEDSEATSSRARTASPAAYRDGGLEFEAAHTRPGSAPRFMAGLRVSTVTWATVLVPVTAVFGLFVTLNVRHLFQGHQLVRSPSGVTYAGHLHQGFNQLLAATVLSVCLVLLGHRLMRRGNADPGETERVVPGGTVLRTLEGSLLVLSMVTLLSCIDRLSIYEEAYGATYLRLGVALVIAIVFVILSLALYKAMRRTWRGFAPWAAIAVTGMALAGSAFDADGYIARRNLDRAANGHALDVEYLAELTADARPQLRHPFLEAPENEELRTELSRRWQIHDGDFRAHRGPRR